MRCARHHAAAVMLPAHAHDIELDRTRGVLFEAKEAEVGLDHERRQRRGSLDVVQGRLLDPEPLGEIAENRFCDSRPFGGIRDLDYFGHGRPVTRRPA
jgi:hypothetical protein